MNTVLYSTLQQILRPLIKLLLSKGLSFAEFSQLAKQIYVEQAEQLLQQNKEKITTSRIAIRTGLTRKDVAKLREAHPTDEHKKTEKKTSTTDAATLSTQSQQLSNKVNRGIRVINGWCGDSAFLDGDGKPADLSLQEPPSFMALVQKYSGDMPYRALLKELLEGGLVIMVENKVHLQQTAYIPNADEQALLKIIGTDTRLLLETMLHNVQAQQQQTPRFFQRKVCYDHLSAETLTLFKQMLHEDGMSLLIKFNDWLRERDGDYQLPAQKVAQRPIQKEAQTSPNTAVSSNQRMPQTTQTNHHVSNDQPSKIEKRYKAGVGIYYFERLMPD